MNIPDQANTIKNYPLCTKCQNYLIFKFQSNKIVLFCDKCYSNISITIDKNLSSIFTHDLINENNSSNTKECKKCKEIFCNECYCNHNDTVISCNLKDSLSNSEILVKNLSYDENYHYYNIKCNKCRKQFLSGIINDEIKIQKSMNEIKRNLKKAQQHIDDYYIKLKNQIITELNEKIKIVTKSFNENYSFHQSIFTLIEQLLSISNKNISDKVKKSLNNLTNFTFPKLNIDNLNNLDEKVKAITYFYQNKFIISEQKKEIKNLFSDIKITTVANKLFQLTDQRFLYYSEENITIFNQYNFQPEISLLYPYGQIICVSEIDKNTLLIGSQQIYFCFFDNNHCSFKQFPINITQLVNILYLKSKQILTCFLDKICISEGVSPYNTIKNIRISSSLPKVMELDDGRIFVVTQGQGTQLLFLNQKNFECKKVICPNIIKNLSYLNSIIELNNKKIILSTKNDIIILNPYTIQIESHLFFEKQICKISETFKGNDCLTVITNQSIDIISCHTLQKILSINHQIKFLLNCHLLGNGTLLLEAKLDYFKYEDD